MLLTVEQIVTALHRRELREHLHQNIELKEDWSLKYGEKLSALANKVHSSVCWLIVGIQNNGGLVGKNEKWAIQREDTISQHINDHLDPIQACIGISCHEISGSWIIIIEVKNPGDIVYWGNNAFISSGTTIKTMEADEILQLRIILPGLIDFSRQPVDTELHENLIEAFTRQITNTGHPMEIGCNSIDALQKLNINCRQVSRILFGNCSFRLIKYDVLGEPFFNTKYYGLYNILTEDFVDAIYKWTSDQIHIGGDPYPRRALKEAIANAVAHAAYFENDGDIIIELYPDKIIISNLCVRESTYFANRWFSRSHKTINSLLMEVLRIARHVDELGRGKHLIFSESIKNGKRSPEVLIEQSGKYNRWKLVLYGGTKDEIQLRLLDRTRMVYKDEQKTLIAHALVLWRDKPVSEIRNYIDGDFSRQFAEVLSSLNGPIFYYEPEDRIVLMRWASVLLGEGQDSKQLSPAEEDRVKSLVYDIGIPYHGGIINPKTLRQLCHMGETPSEKSLSSKLLSKWDREGFIKKLGKGRYQIIGEAKPERPTFELLLKLLQRNK